MDLSYWAQLQSIMRTPIDIQQGADIEEIRNSIRVLDALDEVGIEAEFLELEDSDFEYLVSKIQVAKFTFADLALVQFVDDVTNAE